MEYIAKSKLAKECFTRYEKRGFKILKATKTDFMFVNKNCSTGPDHVAGFDLTTFRFGFWLRRDEVEIVPELKEII